MHSYIHITYNLYVYQFSYVMTLILNGIYQYEGRYATLHKKLSSKGRRRVRYTNRRSALNFSWKTRSVKVSCFGFFQNSRIRVERCNFGTCSVKIDVSQFRRVNASKNATLKHFVNLFRELEVQQTEITDVVLLLPVDALNIHNI